MDTPFGTQLIRYPNPVPNSLGPKKLRSERKFSLDKAFVGQEGGGGMYTQKYQPADSFSGDPPPPCTATEYLRSDSSVSAVLGLYDAEASSARDSLLET